MTGASPRNGFGSPGENHGAADCGEERLSALVAAVGGPVRQAGRETVLHCPGHEDAKPSLHVRVGDDGRLLVKCRAGCDTSQVVAAIGWQMSDLMPPRGPADRPAPRPAKSKKVYSDLGEIASAAACFRQGSVESTHTYENEHRAPVFAAVRVRLEDGGKEVPQVRPQDGGWVFGGVKAPRPLYRLPELLADDEGQVLLFEGEQKADLAAKIGFTATSCSQGAGKAKLTDFAPLRDRQVYLFPDADEAGRAHMQDVAAECEQVGAASVLIVDLPNLPEKGDIVDFCRALKEAGASDEDVRDAILEAITGAAEVERGEADGGGDGQASAEEGASTIADRLVFLAAKADLFHDESGEPYARIRVGEQQETWPTESTHYAKWLRAEYYGECQKAVPPTALTTAVGQIAAIANFEGDEHPVYTRIAEVGGGHWIDLCNASWGAVEVTADRWRVVENPPIRFVRKPGMKALPTPEGGLDNLDRMFDLLQVHDPEFRLLLTAWLVNGLTPSTSYPILALTGEQGSGKTTVSRAMQRLVDPHEMEGRSPPRSEEDIAVAAQNAHVIVYENLSGISPQLSDCLCRVATGAAFTARKLYTNAEERQLRFCRPLIINGIDDLATRADLADRVISITLPRLSTSNRRTETELWAEYDAMYPQLFGALLSILVKVRRTPTVDVPLERMADYSQLGGKVAVALGLDPRAFSDAYSANRDESSITAVESSPVGSVLRRLVREAPFHGLVGGLLHELHRKANNDEQRQAGWPSNARALGGELRRLSPCLDRIGIRIEFLGHRRDGHWVRVEETSRADGHNGHDGHEEAQG